MAQLHKHVTLKATIMGVTPNQGYEIFYLLIPRVCGSLCIEWADLMLCFARLKILLSTNGANNHWINSCMHMPMHHHKLHLFLPVNMPCHNRIIILRCLCLFIYVCIEYSVKLKKSKLYKNYLLILFKVYMQN